MSEEEIIEALNEIAARFREQHLCGYEHVVNAVALIVQQQAQIARVRELHGRLEVAGLSGPSFVCLERYDAEWPCATIRALDGDA